MFRTSSILLIFFFERINCNPTFNASIGFKGNNKSHGLQHTEKFLLLKKNFTFKWAWNGFDD